MKIAVDLDDTLSTVDRVSRTQAYIARKGLPFRMINPDAQRLKDVFDWSEEDVLQFIREGGISVFTEADVRTGVRETLAAWRAAGHTVVVLTAREREMFGNPYNLSRDWLEKRKIPYDELVIETGDKGKYCAEHGISVLVENSVPACLSAQNRGVCAVLALSKETLPRAQEVRYCGANWNKIAEKVAQIARILELERLVSRAVRARKREHYDGWVLSSDTWNEPRGNCVFAATPSLRSLTEKVVL